MRQPSSPSPFAHLMCWLLLLVLGWHSALFPALVGLCSTYNGQLTRTYDSRDTRKGDFGVGWTMSLSDVRFQKNGPVGGAEEARVWRSSTTWSGASYTSIKPRMVSITLPDGQNMSFSAQMPFQSQLGSVIEAQVNWVAGKGAKGATLRSDDGGRVYTSGGGAIALYGPGGDDEDGDPMLGQVYDPHAWTLTLVDGRKLHFTEGGDMTQKGRAKLDWVSDEAGNVLRFGKNGIVSENPDGRVLRRISFDRNPQTGFITAAKVVADVNGVPTSGPPVRYVQNGDNLITVFDRENNPTHFDYLNRAYPHYVTDIRDARGVRVARHFYEGGRLVRTVDADGQEMAFNHDLAAKQETVTNRLGFKTVMLYDGYGNVVETRHELREGTTSKWITSQTAYNDGRNPDSPTSTTQSVTLANGTTREMTSRMTYDAIGNVTSATDPNGNTMQTGYNERGNVEWVKDARGRVVTRNVYNGRVGEYWNPQENVFHKQPEGSLKASINEAGLTTRYFYYPNGALGQVIGPDGRITRYTVDYETGNVTGVESDYGTSRAHKTGFVYDANGNQTERVTTTTDTLSGQSVTLASHTNFDREGRPVLATLPDGTKNFTHYNSTGKVDYSIAGLGSTYNGLSLARTTQHQYDDQGRRTLTQSMDGGQSRTIYDKEGQVTRSLDRAGRGSETVYDSLGRATTSYSLYADGTLDGARILGSDGQPLYTLSRYDELDRPIAERDERGAWSTTRYTTQSETVTLADGTSKTVLLDVTETENALHQVSRSVSDDLGRGWKTFDAKNHLTTSVYDEAGRAVATILHDGTQIRSRLDDLGRTTATWTQDKDGTTTLGWKKMLYTQKGELWKVIQSRQGIPSDDGSGANDLVTTFSYDDLGRKAAQMDANGRITRFGFDVCSRMNRRVLPDGKFETMVYDDLGQLRQKTDFRGQTSDFDYDVRGRMTLKRPGKVPGSDAVEPSVTYSYTGENFKVAKRGELTTTYTYNPKRGWLDSVSGPTGTVNYGYDDVGNRTKVDASGGVTTYGYDELSRMKTVSDQPEGATVSKLLATYGYDVVGNLQSVVTSNGASAPLVTTRYGYDTLNRLDGMSHKRGTLETGALVSGFDYSVRADGKRNGVAETLINGDIVNGAQRVSSRTVGFGYDDAGRLTSESGKDGAGVGYKLGWTLDAVGNRTNETRLRAKDASASDWTGGTLTRTISNYSGSGADWLSLTTTGKGTSTSSGEGFAASTTEAQTSYGYDANGSQTRVTTDGDSDGFEWDFEGHLTRVEKGETNATRFTYDAAGNRIQSLTRNGAVTSVTNFLVDENTDYAQVLEERDALGVLQARYVYGQGFGPLLLQRKQKNATGANEVRTRFLLTDGHGSVRQLVDEEGSVTDSYFYDAWGNSLAGGSGNTINPYRYNGQQTDAATGGYFLRARYYQPGSARFLSHDPILGGDDDPASLHRYLYAGADGVNASDPSGESPTGDVTFSLPTSMRMQVNSSTASTAYYQSVSASTFSVNGGTALLPGITAPVATGGSGALLNFGLAVHVFGAGFGKVATVVLAAIVASHAMLNVQEDLAPLQQRRKLKRSRAEREAEVGDNINWSWVIYAVRDEHGNVVYVGRTGGEGTPQQVMQARASGKNNKKAYGIYEVLDTQKSYSANRGAEEVFLNQHKMTANMQGRQMLNKDNGIDPRRKEEREGYLRAYYQEMQGK